MFHNGARVSERLDSIEAIQSRTIAMTTAISNVLKHLDSSLCAALPGYKTANGISLASELNNKASRECVSIPAAVSSGAGSRKRLQLYHKQWQGTHSQALGSFNSTRDSLCCLPKDCNTDNRSLEPVSMVESMSWMKVPVVQNFSSSESQPKQHEDDALLYAGIPLQSSKEERAWVVIHARKSGLGAPASNSAASPQSISSKSPQEIPSKSFELARKSLSLSSQEVGTALRPVLKSQDLSCEDTQAGKDVELTKRQTNSVFHTPGTCKQPGSGTAEENIKPEWLTMKCQGTEQGTVPLATQIAAQSSDSEPTPVQSMQPRLPLNQSRATSKQLIYC
jgi:hypothetical protein